MNNQDEYMYSDDLPYKLIQELLEKDEVFKNIALKILKVEDRQSTVTANSSVPTVLNHWLVCRDLVARINGNPVDVTSLEVSESSELDNLEEWMTINKHELAALMQKRNIPLPEFLKPVSANSIQPEIQAQPKLGEINQERQTEQEGGAPAQTKPNYEKVLSELFDPVGLQQLEKMFPCGKWAGWGKKAKEKGLDAARIGRAKYNPYLAAQWWLTNRKPEGWDLARVNRVLANNLPHRSRDSKYLVTGELE